jgi:hypothetical protein
MAVSSPCASPLPSGSTVMTTVDGVRAPPLLLPEPDPEPPPEPEPDPEPPPEPEPEPDPPPELEPSEPPSPAPGCGEDAEEPQATTSIPTQRPDSRALVRIVIRHLDRLRVSPPQ